MQPGAVSTSGAGKATAFFTDNDPYTPLHQQLGTLRDAAVTAEEVAATVADTGQARLVGDPHAATTPVP